MRKNAKTTIHNALPIVAAAYGEKFGVKVEIGGQEAYTDGKTITVPNVPQDYNIDVLWGYLAHEAAHVRFTDFSVKRETPIHAALLNVLEDCRIERAMIALYPGTAKTLLDVAQYMADQGHYAHVASKDHPAQVLLGYSLYWLQSQAVGQACLVPFMQSAEKALKELFPQGAIVRLGALLRQSVAAKDTHEIEAIASAILEMIQEEAEAPQEQPGQPQSQQGQGGDGQDEPGTGQGQPQSQQPQGEGQEGDGQDEPGTGQGQPQSQQPQGQGQGGKAQDALKRVLNATGKDIGPDAKESLKRELFEAAKQGDEYFQTVRTGVAAPKNAETAQMLLSEVRGTTSKVRAQLAGMVQAKDRCGLSTRRAGKRLDVSKLHRAALGDTRVFLHREEKQRQNTAVHLLVDMSGSMDSSAANPPHMIARKAALALALALDAIPKVSPAVTFFCGNNQNPVRIAVKHGESVQANAGRFGVLPDGGTPMAEGIWYAAFELSKRREDRKMLIVITDGSPNSFLATEKAIALCEASEVEVIGIGVGTTSVRNLFSKSIVISDFNDLQKTLFQLMEKSLVA